MEERDVAWWFGAARPARCHMRPPTTHELPYRQSQAGELPTEASRTEVSWTEASRTEASLADLLLSEVVVTAGEGPVGVAAADTIPSGGTRASAKIRSGLVR
ncbi:hypothetical protein DCW30_10005 [Streptomyces alfalfae]|uniref:Uncharacterized protein n=1 Tax=Streptomyces alfalfae TaxID=1642299 RepID=A0ABM6GT12_9ACTN|nr:hypothetical protein A7J05_16920 [Streptomyces alfalfae]AYA17592.1 hypothetical protein D3X13_16255 [Streptomyces fradiae]RXX44803.1 hypothetical protein DCW30_10005 [Streptomyces alfalfae]RZM95402.1 hypothetical protein D4104_17810 [Streptomyces alfalfae]